MSSTTKTGRKSGAGKTRKKTVDSSPRRKAILILGVHRSGTSALTRILNLCGASLPAHLMPATEINPRGFFESRPIYKLHEEILGDLASTWHDLSPLPPAWLESSVGDRHVRRMADLVAEGFGDSPLIVLKDPRICRLVPFWLAVLEVLEVEPAFVLPVRNPLEVAHSLEEAEAIERQHALLIWLNGVLQAEHDSRGYKRSFVSYEALLADWRKTVEKIGVDLEIAFHRLGRRAQAEADDFINHRLRHHQVSVDDLSVREDVLDWIKTTFRWMNLAAAGKKTSTRKIDQLYLAFAGAEQAFGPILANAKLARENSETDLMGLRGEIREISRDRDELRGQVVPLNEESSQLKTQLEKRELQVGELINCIKLMLVWIASRAPGSKSSAEELQILLEAMDSSEGESIAETAIEGLRRYQESMESTSIAEEEIPHRRGLRHPLLQATDPDSQRRQSAGERIGDERENEETSKAEILSLKVGNESLREENQNLRDEAHVLNQQGVQKQALLAQALGELARLEEAKSLRDSEYRILEQELRERERKSELDRSELKAETARAQGETARAQGETARAQGEIDEFRQRTAGLEEELRLQQEGATAAARRSELDRAEFESETARAQGETARAQGEIDEFRQRTAGLEEELRLQQEGAAAAAARIEVDRRELQETRKRIGQLTDDRSRTRQRLSEREEILRELQRSRSWRMTLPLRKLGILLEKMRIRRWLRPFGRLPGLRK